MLSLGLTAILIIAPIYPALSMAIWMGQKKEVNIYTLLAVCLLSVSTIVLLSGFVNLLLLHQAQYEPLKYCEQYITSQKDRGEL